MVTASDSPLAYPFEKVPERLQLNPEYLRLQASAPVERIRMPYGRDAWLVTRYRDVRTVLSDRRFSRAPATGEDEPRVHPETRFGGLMTMDPPEHTRLRRFVAKAFTVRRLERLRPRIQDVANGFARQMRAAGPPADLVESFAFPLPVTVMCELLGVPYEEREQFAKWSDALVSTTALTPEQARQYGGELLNYVDALIALRRLEPTEDLLSWLVHAKDENDTLTEAELSNLSIGILVGAFETTANQIPNFLFLLLSHPDQMTLLRRRPDLVPNAVEELLRFVPLAVASAFAHYPTEDVELSGVRIRAGEPVLVSLAAANRDTGTFEDPNTLRLDRTQNPHLGFGHGFHHCLGAHLARIELQETLTVLLDAFPDLRLAVPPKDVPWKRGMFLRGPSALPIAW